MMKLGAATGSLVNYVYSRAQTPEPAVGIGATILMWTDRRAATIVKVTRTQVHVQEDVSTRTDGNGMSESQAYSYAPDPDAPVRIFRRTKNGAYRAPHRGNGLLIGTRETYHDFSF